MIGINNNLVCLALIRIMVIKAMTINIISTAISFFSKFVSIKYFLYDINTNKQIKNTITIKDVKIHPKYSFL